MDDNSRKSTAGPREDSRNPRILVGEVPDRDSHALLDLVASIDGVFVVGRLLLLVLVGLWVVGADVEFGDGEFDPKVGESLHVCDLVCGRRSRAHDHVSLGADAIDLHAVGLDELDDIQGCGCFGSWRFDGAVGQLGSRKSVL